MAVWLIEGVGQVRVRIDADQIRTSDDGKIVTFYSKETDVLAICVLAPGVLICREDSYKMI
jgi:hypothetical protein